MNSISTRRGDSGETSLLYGGRVPKSHRRLEAYGIGDEAVSSLGMARAICDDNWIRSEIIEIQRVMFLLNAELATDITHRDDLRQHFQTISSLHTEALDDLLRRLERAVTMPKAFVIPGASTASASLDVARTIVRRLERAVTHLQDDGELQNAECLRWLNRLSDCIFMMARYVDRDLPAESVTGTRIDT